MADQHPRLPANPHHRDGIFLEILGTKHMRSLGFIDSSGPLENATSHILHPRPDGGFDIISNFAVAQCKCNRAKCTPVAALEQFANDCAGVPRGTNPGTQEHSHKIPVFYAAKMSAKAAQKAEEARIAVFLVDHDGEIKPFNDSAFSLGLAADMRRGNVSLAIADYWSWRMSNVSAVSKFGPLEPLTELLSNVFLRSNVTNLCAAGAKIADRLFFSEREFLQPGPTLEYVRKVLREVDRTSPLLRGPTAELKLMLKSIPVGQLSARHSDGDAFRPLQAMRPSRSSLGSQLPMTQCSVTVTPRCSIGATTSPRCSAGAPKMPPLRAVGGLGRTARAGVAILQLAARAVKQLPTH